MCILCASFARELSQKASHQRAFTDGALSYPDPFKIAAQDDPTRPYLEDIYASPSEGIFTDSSYDAHGVVTDFNNLETTVNVSPTPTTRIHTIHPKTQILKDPNSAVQTKSKENKNSEAHALKISQALEDESWVDGMQEELLNKKDERGVVVRNKACLVTQGYRQDERIDYDEVTPKTSHLHVVKRIFRYLKGKPKLGLWYPKLSSFDLEAYSDSDYAGANLDRKSTIRGCQFLGKRLILWQCKSRLLWLLLLQRNACEKKLIHVLKIHTADNVADLLTKAFDVSRNECSLSVGFNTTQQMVISSPCLIHIKNWLAQKQTVSGVNIPRCNEDNLELKELMVSFVPICFEKDGVRVNAGDLQSKLLTRSDMRTQQVLPSVHLVSSSFGQRPSAIVLKPPPGMNLAALWQQQSSVLPQTRSLTSQVDHQLGDMSHHQDIYDNPSITKKVFGNIKIVGTGFSRLITPLFENMLVIAAEEVGQAQDDVSIPTKPSTSKPHKKHKLKKHQPIAPKVPSPEPSPEHQLPSPFNDPIHTAKDSLKLQELMNLCIRLSNKVLDLDSQKNSFKSAKINTAAPVEDKEELFKQRRMRVDMDEDVEVNLEEAHAKACNLDLQHSKKVLSMQDIDEEEPAEMEEVLEVVRAAKLITEVVTTDEPTTTGAQVPKVSAPRRRRGVVIQDPEETTTSVIMHTENDVIEQVKRSERQNNIVMRYQALKRKPLTEAQARKNMMIYLKNMPGFKMNFFKGMTYSEIRPLFEKHYNLNQAFLEKVKEEVIVQEKEIEEEEATHLASKVLVVDYQIHHENNKPYYKIIRADGSHKLFLSFITLLKNFDREDLETLWKLVDKLLTSLTQEAQLLNASYKKHTSKKPRA
nr:hypothetical protein [Tanacetum cinerariifolium]